MRLQIYEQTVLAIELRHRQFGYAIYRGHRELLDWGVRVYPAVGEAEAAMASKRLIGLLRMFVPERIVIKTERWNKAETNAHMRSLVEAVRHEAFAHAIPIFAVTEKDVRQTFLNFGCETRDEIAAALARIFPELVWNLPSKRRPWQSENRQMAMFDAVALGLAYWRHPSTEVSNSPG
jgi:hypothetical protein